MDQVFSFLKDLILNKLSLFIKILSNVILESCIAVVSAMAGALGIGEMNRRQLL